MSTARLDDDFWTDPKIEQLKPEEKLLFVWFFTNPYRNWIGLYKLPKPMIKEHTGLSDTSIDRGIDTLIHMGLISYNSDFKMVFVKSMLKRQMSQNEGQEKLSKSQYKGIINQLSSLHNCPLIQEFLAKYSYLNISYEYTPTDTPTDTPMYINPNPQPNPNKYISPKKSKIKKQKTCLPDDFTISESVKSWAKTHGHENLQSHLEAFKDRAIAKGYQYENWDRAFMLAIRENWGKIGGNGTTPQTRLDDACTNHPDRRGVKTIANRWYCRACVDNIEKIEAGQSDKNLRVGELITKLTMV